MLGATTADAEPRRTTAPSEAKERARTVARRTAEEAKEEVGRIALDTVEEYFPEQAKKRRRRRYARLLVVGFGIGFLARHLLGRRS